MKPTDLAIALFVILIWGLNFAVVKIGLAEIPPFLLMTLRFAIVALLLVPFIKWPKGKFLHLLIYSVILGVLHFACMFNAVGLTDAATIALLAQLNTPFAVILAALIYKDYPGWRRIMGILIAFAGCAVIAGEPGFEGGILPVILVIMGTFLWAVANIQMKFLGDIGPFELNGWMALMATPQLLLITFLYEDFAPTMLLDFSATAWFAILFQSVAVVITGYGLWFVLLKRYPISKLIPLTLLLPVVGVVGGVVLLGEELTSYMLSGGALVMVGVGIITLRQLKKAPAHQPRTPKTL